MVDKFMIPKKEAEFKWLNENLDTVTHLYDNQRKIQAESQRRLFSAKRATEMK